MEALRKMAFQHRELWENQLAPVGNKLRKMKRQLTVKIQTDEKLKRIREQPDSLAALRHQVEAVSGTHPTNLSVSYIDDEAEEVNISDEDDFLTAMELAQTKLGNSIKFIVKDKNEPAKKK